MSIVRYTEDIDPIPTHLLVGSTRISRGPSMRQCVPKLLAVGSRPVGRDRNLLRDRGQRWRGWSDPRVRRAQWLPPARVAPYDGRPTSPPVAVTSDHGARRGTTVRLRARTCRGTTVTSSRGASPRTQFGSERVFDCRCAQRTRTRATITPLHARARARVDPATHGCTIIAGSTCALARTRARVYG